MNSFIVITVIGIYFLVLILISQFTAKNADTKTFFTANRQSPWYLVAFGMIGASLSGVTFISVPGWVADSQFSYMQMVLGYLAGYAFIALVLLPLYYKLNLVSIYTYLEQRFGFWSYKTGAFFFIVSRVVQAAFRLFMVAAVLQLAIFDAWNLPFWIAVAVTILLIWVYTFRGGIKTIVWTDSLQTFFMLLAVTMSIWLIKNQLGLNFSEMVGQISDSDYSQVFFWEWNDSKNFFKQFASGALIAVVMTGLDQDMMQKNLTCRSLGDAQKNVFWFSIVLVFVNMLFLGLGAMLYIFAENFQIAIPERSDHLFPILALDHFSIMVGILFLLGITAAAYSSADSALTALTTSFCVDFLDFERKERDEVSRKKIKLIVHIGFSILLFLVIIAFEALDNQSVISRLFVAAGYTYGPILGLFIFGLYMPYNLKDKYVPMVCLLSPVISYILDQNSETWFNGFEFGYLILLINGMLTFFGLWLISSPSEQSNKAIVYR